MKVSSQMGVGGPLISSPATSHFLPAIRVPELQDSIVSQVAGKLKMLACIAAFFSVLCAVLLVVHPPRDVPTVVRMAILMALVAGFWFYSYRVASRDPPVYREWTTYLDWQRRFAGVNLWLPLSLIAAFGLAQWGFSIAGYSRDDVLQRLGVVFASIDRGEYWRFLVGPMLHANVSHWVLNVLMCLLALPCLTPFRYRWSVLLLAYLSVVLSGVVVYAQHRWGAVAAVIDSFAGVSALIYFACGFAIANVLAHRDWYPRRYASWLSVSTFILLVSPHVVSGNISLAAHATGLLVGLMVGGLFQPVARK